ncbi:hypothetical protein HOY80DRAFT_744481 [Tuber brumale]|nr:hypothetical protein HOY80DRAFT_744481 [Tuber brumale]
MSKLMAIKDTYGDGVRAIFKDNTTAFLKAWKKETKEARKVARLQRKPESHMWRKELETTKGGNYLSVCPLHMCYSDFFAGCEKWAGKLICQFTEGPSEVPVLQFRRLQLFDYFFSWRIFSSVVRPASSTTVV